LCLEYLSNDVKRVEYTLPVLWFGDILSIYWCENSSIISNKYNIFILVIVKLLQNKTLGKNGVD